MKFHLIQPGTIGRRHEIEKGMAATTSTARIEAYEHAVREAGRIEDGAARREALTAAAGMLSHR